MKLEAPFPYFGGKSGAVAEVWAAFGPVKNYVEPCVAAEIDQHDLFGVAA